MADYTQTAVNVALISGPTSRGLCGGVNSGEPLFVDHTDEAKLKAADVNATNPRNAVIKGFCIESALDDELTTMALAGAIVDPGMTMTKGDIVVLSESGAMSPSDDLTTGDYVAIVGVAMDTDRLELILWSRGVKR